jgi:predicted alpha/beta hydrolase
MIKTRSQSAYEMASYTPMIIAFLLASFVVVSIHLFVMDSVDKFNGYGDSGGSYREWREFEKQKLSL